MSHYTPSPGEALALALFVAAYVAVEIYSLRRPSGDDS